jgi:hypothetical protein
VRLHDSLEKREGHRHTQAVEQNALNTHFLVAYTERRATSAEYLARAIQDLGNSLSGACHACDDLRITVLGAIAGAFQALDALPRSAVLWQNTNGLPTLTKLAEFAATMLPATGDPSFAFAAIGIALAHGSDHLQPIWWRPLLCSYPPSARWLVRTAWNMSSYWFHANVDPLCRIATDLGCVEAIRDEVRNLRTTEPDAVKWCEQVLIASGIE